MEAQTPAEQEQDRAHAAMEIAEVERTAGLGLIFFAVYVIFYLGFVLLAVFGQETMAKTAFAGVNVAVLYGVGLIVLAIVMAMIYTLLARN